MASPAADCHVHPPRAIHMPVPPPPASSSTPCANVNELRAHPPRWLSCPPKPHRRSPLARPSQLLTRTPLPASLPRILETPDPPPYSVSRSSSPSRPRTPPSATTSSLVSPGSPYTVVPTGSSRPRSAQSGPSTSQPAHFGTHSRARSAQTLSLTPLRPPSPPLPFCPSSSSSSSSSASSSGRRPPRDSRSRSQQRRRALSDAIDSSHEDLFTPSFPPVVVPTPVPLTSHDSVFFADDPDPEDDPPPPFPGSPGPSTSTASFHLSAQAVMMTTPSGATTSGMMLQPRIYSNPQSELSLRWKSASSPQLHADASTSTRASPFISNTGSPDSGDESDPILFSSRHPAAALTTPSDRPDRPNVSTTQTVFGGAFGRSIQSLRARIGLKSRGDPSVPKGITTGRGQLGAGETETEADEPPRHLPTARITSPSPLFPPNPLERITPYLFEVSRLLSIVPAVSGALYNTYLTYNPPPGPNSRVDYAVCILWAILTGAQCLALTTGLLSRWKAYYPPLPTLIRLLALQAICWPAHQATFAFLDPSGRAWGEGGERPLLCWAVVGTTTCVSRSVQIWVTSNLWVQGGQERGGHGHGHGHGHNAGGGGEHRRSGDHHQHSRAGQTQGQGPGQGWASIGGGWRGRRWNWRVVGVYCALPAGIVYVVMAWALLLKAEWERAMAAASSVGG